MSHISPVNSSQKSTSHVNSGGTRKINRSKITPNQQPFPSIQPNLNDIKKEPFFLKNVLEEYGVSEESCKTLQTIMQFTQTGGNFSLIQNLIYYLHSQFLLLKDSVRNSSVDSFKLIEKDFYFAFLVIPIYPILRRIDCVKDYKDYKNCKYSGHLIDRLNLIGLYQELMMIEYSSDDYKREVMHSFQRFKGDHQKKYEEIRGKIIKPLEEIGKTLECISELFLKVPKENSSIFTDARMDKNMRYVKEDFFNFKEVLLKIFDSLNNEEKFSKDYYYEIFETMIKLNEEKHCSRILEHYYSLSSIVNKIDVAFSLSISGNKTESYAANFIFKCLLRPFIKISVQEICENYYFQISEIPLIDIHTIRIKLVLSQEEKSSKMFSILTKNFSDALSVLSMSKDSSAKIQKCLDKINELISNTKEKDLIDFIDKIVDPINKFESGLIYFNYLKEKSCSLIEEINNFEKLMKNCNQALQKELDTSDLSNDELKLLKQKILSYKTDISQILCPILKLPSVLDCFVICDKKSNKSNNKSISTYRPELEDDVKLLFDIKFKKYAEKQEVIKSEDKENKEIELPQEIKEPEPIFTPTIDEPKIALDDPPLITPVKKEKVKVADKEIVDRPKTTRTAVILAYLDDKGWKPASVNGSHIKLKKENESLIIPFHKAQDHLPKGTLGAIFRQLDEKEEKIVSRDL
jgi:predicted RNA binding protein YcfA (HicA-like mRNA interferase family)